MEVTKEQINQLDGHVKGIDAKVTSILVLLSGNRLDKNDKGMIGEQTELKERVDKLEKFKDRMVYLLIGMAIPAGYGLTELIGHLISK